MKKPIIVLALLLMFCLMGYSQSSGTSSGITMNTESDTDVSAGSGENCESTTVWVPVNIAGFIIPVPVTVEECES